MFKTQFNVEKCIEALKAVKRIHSLWYVAKTPLTAISFTSALKACEDAKLFGTAVKLRTIENFFVFNEFELNERFNKIIKEIEDLINAQKQTESINKSKSRSLVGNSSAEKRIVN